MTDLVPYKQPAPSPGKWVELMTPAADLAREIANTDFVPGAMRNKPAVVTACILFGDELGIGPMQSLAKIDVIDGRPAPKAELARALVLAAGHDLWFIEQTNTKCTVAGQRKGSPNVQQVTWTMDDAKRAGLDGKQNWRKWPRAMLAARASAELCRLAFSDCLGGIGYFAEELEDDHDQTPTAPAPIAAVTAAPAKAKNTRRLNPAPVLESDDLPPLPDEEAPAADTITEPQTKKLMALFNALEVTERDDRMALCTSLAGRPLASSKDLTKAEASHIIDRLSAVEAGTADIVFDDGVPTVADNSLGLESA